MKIWHVLSHDCNPDPDPGLTPMIDLADHAAEVSALREMAEDVMLMSDDLGLDTETPEAIISATSDKVRLAVRALLEERDSLRAQLEAAKKLMRSIAENDKTPDYGYTGKTCLNRVGAHPGMGTRWATPRDMARDFLLHNDKKEVAS